MKTILTLILAILVIPAFLSAQILSGEDAERKIKGTQSITLNNISDVPSFIEFRNGSELDLAKFDSWLHTTFSLAPDNKLRLLNTENDQLGMQHYRYEQTYKDIPLEGTMFIVHTKNSKILSMNGLFFDQIERLNKASQISETNALSKALTYVNAEAYQWQSEAAEKLLKETMNDPNATWYPKGYLVFAPKQGEYKAENYRLAYRFDVYAEKPLKRNYIYIDAVSGEILLDRNRIMNASGCTGYSGSQTFTSDLISGAYNLIEGAPRGLGIETYDMRNTTSLAWQFTNPSTSSNNWCAPFFPTSNVLDKYALDAHWGAEKTWDYYSFNFGRNSVNNSGQKLLSMVHYGVNYFNAFWDGTFVVYGDASFPYTPLTSLEITGHEFSHGVTQNTSNLIYEKEPGALNESFSDCMGISIRRFGKAAGTIDWLVGNEVGLILRDMANPKLKGQPDTYLGQYWINTAGCSPLQANDYCGIHTNSGVMNKWFYLVTMGGSGTNDNADNYNVSSIGIDKAAAITYRMQSVYNISNSQYADVRSNSIQAAIDLFGSGSQEVITTTDAWCAVGVYGASSCGTVHTEPCDDFNNQNFSGWTADGVFLSTATPGPDGAADYYLNIGDIGGTASLSYNSSYAGNWEANYSGKCLNFDFKVIDDMEPGSPNTGVYPFVSIISDAYPGTLRADFILDPSTVLNENTPWKTFCAPISAGGAPPSNSYGHWQMVPPGSNAQWNTLLRNVSNVIISGDCYGSGNDVTGFDNICIKECIPGPPCVDLDNQIISDWIPAPFSYSVTTSVGEHQPSGSGDHYILLEDGSSLSEIYNTSFSGNWSTFIDKSLCFDFKVIDDYRSGSPNIEALPYVSLIKGSYDNPILRADFKLYPIGITELDPWRTFCVPINSCTGSSLPNNSFGYWQMVIGNNDCTDWNILLCSVSSLVLSGDCMDGPDLSGFDNICLKACPTAKICAKTICPSNQFTVCLAKSYSPFEIVQTSVGFPDAQGCNNYIFPNANPGESYYIVIKTANSIETWSATPQIVNGSTRLEYDFTTDASKAYGNNMVNINGVWTLLSGDVNQDGLIDLSDIVTINNDAGIFSAGITDLNCDGVTDLLDLIIAYNNSVISGEVKKP